MYDKTVFTDLSNDELLTIDGGFITTMVDFFSNTWNSFTTVVQNIWSRMCFC